MGIRKLVDWVLGGRRRWLALAVLVMPALVLFWEIVFAGRVLFWGTPLMQFGPWYQAAAEAVRAGEWPLWNPLVGNGAPLLANYQSAPFYPPNWLHLLLPPARAMSLLMVLHVLWAGLGMWLYGRAIGLRPFPRLVSALSFMFSGYLVSRLGFISIGSALPWLPWLFWAAERLVRRLGVGGAAVLGLCLGMQWLAGHAQTSFYSGLALGGYVIWRVLPPPQPPLSGGEWRLRFATCAFLAAAIGFGLAAVQLLPTAELQQLSQRAAGVETGFAMTYSLWPLRLIAFVAPRFFGHPATGNYWGYCCNYWEDNGYVGLLPLLLALGAMGAWLRAKIPNSQSPISPPKGRTNFPISFFTLLSLAALLLAFGVHIPIYPFFFEHVPGFGQFQAPARLLCLWTLGVSVLAGIGAELWRPTIRVKKAARYGIVIGLALLIAAGGATQILTGKTLTFVVGVAQLGVSLVVIGGLALRQPRRAGTLVLAVSARAETRLYGRWAAVVLLFIAADLVVADWGANPTAEPWLYTRPTESAAALRAAGLDGRTFYPSADEHAITFDHYLSFQSFDPAKAERWFDMRETLAPDMGILDGIPSANNFDPLRPARYVDLAAAIEDAPPETQVKLLRMMGVETLITERERPDLATVHSNGDVFFSALPDPLPRAYLVFAAQSVSGPEQALQAITDPGFDPTRTVVLESPAVLPNSQISQFPAPQPTLTATHNTVTIRAALPVDGYLVLSDTYYPGWLAQVDGRPATIYPANLAFRAVALPAGEHLVEFYYRPVSFRWGAAVTVVTWLFLFGLLIGRWLKKDH